MLSLVNLYSSIRRVLQLQTPYKNSVSIEKSRFSSTNTMYTPVLSCQETNFFERLGQKLKTNLSFLVILSFDRYLCVVYPIETMVYRTLKNAVIGCIISWIRFNIHYHMFSKRKLLLTVTIIQSQGQGLRGHLHPTNMVNPALPVRVHRTGRSIDGKGLNRT